VPTSKGRRREGKGNWGREGGERKGWGSGGGKERRKSVVFD